VVFTKRCGYLSLEEVDSPFKFPSNLVRAMIHCIGYEDTARKKNRERFERSTDRRLMHRYGLERTVNGFTYGDCKVEFTGIYSIMSKQGNVLVPSGIAFDERLAPFIVDYVNAWIGYYSSQNIPHH